MVFEGNLLVVDCVVFEGNLLVVDCVVCEGGLVGGGLCGL